jgi:hypothetical protein
MSRVEELVWAQLEKVACLQLNVKVKEGPVTSNFVDNCRLLSLWEGLGPQSISSSA